MTKHFYCTCERCQDPKEFGSGLSGLKCTNPEGCQGVLYPVEPLEKDSKWLCDVCGFGVSRNGVGMIQSALGSMLQASNLAVPKELIQLLQDRIHKCLPMTNQIVMELKSRLIWTIGRTPGCSWDGKR